MYFDAVIDEKFGGVLFNGTRDETLKFLEVQHWAEHESCVIVIDGETLKSMSVSEYIKKS